jgi:uncharacterized protein
MDWGGAVMEPAKTDRFGRLRYKAISVFSGSIASIIFSTLGSEAISIVSFRPVSADERKTFNEQDKAAY